MFKEQRTIPAPGRAKKKDNRQRDNTKSDKLGTLEAQRSADNQGLAIISPTVMISVRDYSGTDEINGFFVDGIDETLNSCWPTHRRSSSERCNVLNKSFSSRPTEEVSGWTNS